MFGEGKALYGLVYFLVICGLCVLHALFSRKSASRIPGPFLARWTHLWLAYHAYRGRRYKAVHAAHLRYGRFVRIAPNHVSVAAPEALSVIYGQGPRAPAKSAFYDSFVCNGKPSIFSTRDRQDHSTKRRIVSHAFSSSALQEFIPLIHSTIGYFTERMDEFCNTGEYFDILLWVNYLAFDVLSDLAFGERIGMLKQGSDLVEIQRAGEALVRENAIALVDEREHLAAIVGIHPFLQVAVNALPFLSGNKATSGLEELARRQVLKRLSSRDNRNDILGKLITARGYDVRPPNTDEVAELTSEAVTLLIAGSDTTSNSISVILHFIATHPRVYTKLMGLLLEASCGEKELSYERAKDVPYLQAAINEGLRLHSTTAIGLHRSAPVDGLVCCGQFFPEGTELSVPAWTIGHNAELWGDPESFRPERACIGQNLAYIEMISVLATILLRYKVEVKSPVLETTEGFMHKPLHCWIKMSLR
ncbi:benzoate para-hydroxylase [Mycena galopus ATCC 62051]|nr:benzoate para-hydroxylase [Mycena galopus ATCC 62051]